jgi:NAD(P)-dependent dehydrogenase (short-subunit alcohol dehydrogenase family)
MQGDPKQRKAALITGGSSGVGLATARVLLSEGYRVMITGRDESRLARAKGVLASVGGELQTHSSDVRRVSQCKAAVEKSLDLFGRLDVLVNSAGVWIQGPAVRSEERDWDAVIDTNLKGTYFMCVFAIPHLKRTQGCIVNVSSDGGIMGLDEAAIYSASKGGVNLLTKSLAVELAGDLVRVNAVCPADIDTPMTRRAMADYGPDDEETYFAQMLSAYPQGERARLIEPEEVADLIAFLASDKAGAITGALFRIDFGMTAGY